MRQSGLWVSLSCALLVGCVHEGEPHSSSPTPGAPAHQQSQVSPAINFDRFVAPPKLFGLELGADTPETAMRKLKLDPHVNATDCADDPNVTYRFAQLYCWRGSLFHQATRIRLLFVNVGSGPVLEGARLELPTASWPTVSAELEQQWGAPDTQADPARPFHSEWAWGWGEFTAFRFDDEPGQPVIISADSLLLFGRAAKLGTRRPDDERSGGSHHEVRPFGLHLAYDSKEVALRKLSEAGFQPGGMGCERSYPRAPDRVFVSCSLTNSRLTGFKFGTANFVDLGDGLLRLAHLEYFFDASSEQTLLSELTGLYGPAGEPRDWWIGSDHVTLTTVPSASTTVTYEHGRLAQVWWSGMWEDKKAGESQQRRAL
jgi:hypothetical protein